MKFSPLSLCFLILVSGLVGFIPVCSGAKMGGYIKTTGYYFTEILEDKERVDMQINLENSFSFYNMGKGFFSGKFYADDLLGKHSNNEPSLEEAYLDIYTKEADIRLGKQYIFWGRTSGVDTPTNNINSQNLTRIKPDPEELRIATGALKINYFRGYDLVFQGVWVPGFTPDKLPSPALPSGIRIGERKIPDPELKNSSWGLKVDRFGRIGDFSLSYLYTWDSFPDYEYEKGSLGITLSPVYHRVGIFGADFATGIGGFDIRGEAAYFKTRDEDGTSVFIKNPHLKYTLEAGYPVTDNFDVILQIGGKKIFNFVPPEEYPGFPEELVEQIAFFYGEQKEWQNLLLLHLTYRMWYERLELEFRGEYNLTLQDYLLSPKLSYHMGRGFNVGFGGMIFEGEPQTRFGAMDRKDLIWCELSYSF